MTPEMNDAGFEEQDQSEVFDEDNQALDGAGAGSADFKTLEEIPNVLDVTAAVGDADDDAGLIAEDLDDDDIVALETEADLADMEDDELAARMPEALRQAIDPRDAIDGVDRSDDPDEVELVYSNNLDNVSAADASLLEADTLGDDAIEELGYDDAPSSAAVPDGQARQPARFDISLSESVWVLKRDGHAVHQYGHADRAVHEAAELARELRRTGEPAVVFLQPSQGKLIEITDDDPGPEAPEDEVSSIIADRSGA